MNTIEMCAQLRKVGKVVKTTPIVDEIGTLLIEKLKTAEESVYTIISRDGAPIVILYGYETFKMKEAISHKYGED